MSKTYKVYREGNYIRVIDVLTNELFNGAIKEVFIDKSNVQRNEYTISKVKYFNEAEVLHIGNILKQDNTAYSISEWETFYTENTGNFNGGGAAPETTTNKVSTYTVDGTGTKYYSSDYVNQAVSQLEQDIDSQITNSTALSNPNIPIVQTGNVHILGVGAGTYTNWGGMVIPANNIGTLRRVNGVFSVSLTPITLPIVNGLTSTSTTSAGSANNDRLLDEKIANGVPNWSAAAYLVNNEVIHLGKLWRANSNTLSTDVPGTSPKWVDVLDYIENSDIEIFSKNEIDLTKSYIIIGKGVGNDGVVFSSATFGMIEGIPVLANTSYVISGCPALRGLRFETANGTLISFIGTISNGTPFTTPANTARISFQVYSTTTGSLFSLVQLEKGTVATAYSPFNAILKSILGATVKHFDKEVYSKVESDSIINPIINNVASNGLKIDNLSIKKTYTNQITPSNTYNYLLFSNNTGLTPSTQEQAQIQSWYYAKSVKTIRSIGVFIYKDTLNGSFTQNIRVQIIHKRGSTNSVVLNTIISALTLTTNNTRGIIGSLSNYEIKLDFPNDLVLAVDDLIFVDIQAPDRLTVIFGSANALLSTGEWNYNNNCYRNWITPSNGTIYANAPALPSVNPNYNALHFYSLAQSTVDIVNELDLLKEKEIIISKDIVIGKNKFNKAESPVGNYTIGTGIGNDGIIYLASNTGAAIGVPVVENTAYVISGCPGLRGLRFETANGTLISFIGTISSGTMFVTPANTARISFHMHSSASSVANTVQVEQGIVTTAYENYVKTSYVSALNGDPIASSGGDNSNKLDYELLLPKNIYSIINNINGDFSTNVNTSLWVQKLIREKKNLLINGLNAVTLNKYKNTNPVDINNVNLLVTGEDFLTKLISIPRVSVRSSILATQFPKVLYLGDSITENKLRNGLVAGAGALWTMPEEIALKNKIDNAGIGYDYLCVGRLMKLDTTINYKNQNVNLVGYAEGKGGWSAMGYLRHPFRMWVFNNQGAWDLLGLTTLMGRNYVDNANDRKLIATTIYGVNTPLITANSYDLLVKENEITNLGAWTNSAPQITAVQNWITGIANDTNTRNEFFDINKSGTNRFSVVKYLNSYKTLANNGITRLSVGSTAGTKVTNATSSDVCEPTHVVICLGENDRIHYTDHVQIANDIMELASTICAELPNIHVGIALTAIPGDMFPERNPDYSGFFYQNEHNNKYDLYKELSSRFGDIATQKTNKIYLIPTWHTGTPLSNSLTREVISENEPNKIVQLGNDDYNHPGYYHNRSAGVQVYGWVAYTFS